MNHHKSSEEINAILHGVVPTIVYGVEDKEKQLRLLGKNRDLAHQLNSQGGHPSGDIEQVFAQALSLVESGSVGWQ